MVAIGLIGDICRALGDQSAPFCNAFMQVLYENLSSEVLTRNVKIPIISCFGDIALAIGPQFEPYLNATMAVLRQAGEMEADPVSTLSIGVHAVTDLLNLLPAGLRLD